MYCVCCTVSDSEKQNAAINFRVPGSFRDKVDELASESGWTATEICKFGLVVHWPDIVGLVRMSGPRPPESPEQVRELRDLIDLCRSAKLRGVDLRKALTDALEAKLSEEAAA